LESLFQRELGMSVMGFLAQVRVNRIKLALEKEPAHSLEELVLLTGFRDADELKETFRQTAGIALVDYRKSLSTEQTYAS
jgi:transcriptional regulator GlxA family with amidase domain